MGKEKDTFATLKSELKRGKIDTAKARGFEKNARLLLYTGIIYHRLTLGLTWDELRAKIEEKGVKVGAVGFRKYGNNWAGNYLVFFSTIYTALNLPCPTPELLVYWSAEIARIEGERKAQREEVKREKERRRLERIEAAKNKLLNNNKLR